MSDQIPTPPPAAPSSPYVAPAAGPKQGLSLSSFIVGIAAFIFGWIPFAGVIVAIVAIVLGFIARSKEPVAPKWMWIVGLITGFLGLITGLIFTILVIVAGVIVANHPGDYVYN